MNCHCSWPVEPPQALHWSRMLGRIRRSCAGSCGACNAGRILHRCCWYSQTKCLLQCQWDRRRQTCGVQLCRLFPKVWPLPHCWSLVDEGSGGGGYWMCFYEREVDVLSSSHHVNTPFFLWSFHCLLFIVVIPRSLGRITFSDSFANSISRMREK